MLKVSEGKKSLEGIETHSSPYREDFEILGQKERNPWKGLKQKQRINLFIFSLLSEGKKSLEGIET